MTTSFQLRRDTLVNWREQNPILAAGEIAYITNTGGYVVGDGTTRFGDLPEATQAHTAVGAMMMRGVSLEVAQPGEMIAYAVDIGGRMMLKQVGPSQPSTALQPLLARNKVGIWSPAGNSSSNPGIFGYTAVTAIGSTSRNVGTGNAFLRTRRMGYISAAGAGSLCGSRVAVAQVTTGDGSLGGFMKVCRFVIGDAGTLATPPDARTFIGVSADTGAPSNVEPSTLTNVIGVGELAADSNFKIIYGGSAAQTPIDCGPNFPTRANADVYEVIVYCPVTGGAFVTLNRLNTGHSHTSFIAGGSSVTLPATTQLLTYHQAWRTNNATGTTVEIGIISDYIETDT